jgi:hypothetical protein
MTKGWCSSTQYGKLGHRGSLDGDTKIKQMTSMDSVPLASIERITRQAGKRVLHGEFGSRHITFTDKLKRDECLHLLMAGNSRSRTLMQELE